MNGPSSKVDISIVVPVWNDLESVKIFTKKIKQILQPIDVIYEIIFCVDPSNDGTEDLIKSYTTNDRRIKAIFFASRCGQPASTLAGLRHSIGSAVIVIDVDLQDPLELIPKLIDKWKSGSKLVIPRRSSRSGEPISKKITASTGYLFLDKFGNAPIPKNTGDYRIMDRSIVNRVLSLRESHVFLRGLVALVENQPEFIEFERPPRIQGKTKYNKWFGGIKSGLNGIISYSTALLDWLIIAGTLMACISFILGAKLVIFKLTGHYVVEGNTQLFAMVTFIGGMQLIGIGILGLYVGRIFEEVKLRPRWLIKESSGIENLDFFDFERTSIQPRIGNAN